LIHFYKRYVEEIGCIPFQSVLLLHWWRID